MLCQHEGSGRAAGWLRPVARVALLVLALGTARPGAVRAGVLFQFDPEGQGNAAAEQIGGFDFSVGNFLAQNLNPALQNWRPTLDLSDPTQRASIQFRGFYQATLAGLVDPNGTTVIPDGLNRNYEITVVASVNLEVTNVVNAGGTLGDVQLASYAVAADQQGSFIRLYHDSQVNADNLAGTGFDDGTLIAQSLPEASSDGTGAFVTQMQTPGNPLTGLFDRFGIDNWGGTQTVTRTGSLVVRGANNYLNALFFIESPKELLLNTTTTTPFNSTNPSLAFLGTTPDLGSGSRTNGLTGKDVLFQADGNAQGLMTAPIPEPGTLGLAALGTLALLAGARRTRRPAL